MIEESSWEILILLAKCNQRGILDEGEDDEMREERDGEREEEELSGNEMNIYMGGRE